MLLGYLLIVAGAMVAVGFAICARSAHHSMYFGILSARDWLRWVTCLAIAPVAGLLAVIIARKPSTSNTLNPSSP